LHSQTKSAATIRPGRHYPLGATRDGSGDGAGGHAGDGGGTNFAIFSQHATSVELCLFDSPGASSETQRIALPRRTNLVWHGYVPGVGPGQLYGYRVHGPYQPEQGHRFNPNKVLLDPYAKAIGRGIEWRDELYGHRRGDPAGDASFDDRDSAEWAALGVVIEGAFDWGDDRAPRTSWRDTILYEAHVRGLTKLHPGVPSELRGTYAGLCSDAAIQHMLDLGVTAVQLMPVHFHVDERNLVERGLRNYWGYNTLGYFAPETRYAADRSPEGVIREFKQMVRKLHAAGLEVILDVVYNHTAEGDESGPTLSLRGIDNAVYYRLKPGNLRATLDFSGCGNTLNTSHPRVVQLITDSLRYWVSEMHADGFRFDLASALARADHGIDMKSAFFAAVSQDPVLSRVKLIAEPWDLGEGGYQVGQFPPGWSELNGRFRDDVRRFWRGDGTMPAAMATRLAGSSDLYAHSGREPSASVNFVTSHDGFTLEDLVTYSEKHNEANGENNRDGENENHSSNCGVEGITDDHGVRGLRARQKRGLAAAMLFSQGVPLISAGDELGRTQQGNNNAYCQDNELSWLSWELTAGQEEFFEFVRRAISARRNQPVLRRRDFFDGQAILGIEGKDLTWYHPDGRELSGHAWHETLLACFGALLYGEESEKGGERGEVRLGDTLFLMLNAGGEEIPFVLPSNIASGRWECLLDTAQSDGGHVMIQTSKAHALQGCGVALFRLVPAE